MIEQAHDYIAEGFAALPLNSNKSPKLPTGHNFLYELIPGNEIEKYFLGAAKIGIACGKVSDGFEALDFDAHDGEPIRQIFNDYMRDEGVQTIVETNNLPVIKTPSGGFHIYYKCDIDEGGKTLAHWGSGGVMIETRGSGQYVATIPSEGYQLIKGSEIIKLAKLTTDERDYLHATAEKFSQQEINPEQSGSGKWPEKFDILTAWGRFNENGKAEAVKILTELGWEYVRERYDKVEMWRRPGKQKGISATMGKLHNMFYVFTDAAQPFQKGHGYTFFDILLKLKFNNDKAAAINYLREKYKIENYKPVVRTNTVDFPIEAFPEQIQNYIKEQNKISNFDVNLLCSTFIWLTSVLIGNKAKTKIWDTWNISPVMWLMIIAERGSMKTHAINAIIAPAKKIDSDNRKKYEEQLKMTGEDEQQPIWKQIFLEDGTREGFVKAILQNPGGMGLMKDELTGWLRDMDRHSGTTGGDEAFWLASFNNSSYTKNIKSESPTHVERMFISLAGSIQPDVVNDLAREHSENGLMDRFLYVPYKAKAFTFSLDRPENTYYQSYCQFVNGIYSNVSVLDAHEFIISLEAKADFEKYYNELLKAQENEENPRMSSYYAKLVTYFPRICLIMEVIRQVADPAEYWNYSITIDSVLKSKDIINYYRNTAEQLYVEMDTKVDMKTIIKSEGAVKRQDKVIALIREKNTGNLDVSYAEIARFTGVSSRMVSHYKKQLTSTQSK